ncbi:hypothetical protein CEXT_748111 [Caerostris extrusa]|uniref:Uncharacterized protein n=1 Tax=Caerostris extrusa TaxID=172846 RepID=A0AAV4QQ55_CAEEX|nr:hypothetical protein CEXT_748111 [Caerostris extrusa]
MLRKTIPNPKLVLYTVPSWISFNRMLKCVLRGRREKKKFRRKEEEEKEKSGWKEERKSEEVFPPLPLRRVANKISLYATVCPPNEEICHDRLLDSQDLNKEKCVVSAPLHFLLR